MAPAELQEPLLPKRQGASRGAAAKGAGGEAGGYLSEGSAASAIVLMSSAAIGTGVLALPYGVSRVGVLPALLIFGLAAAASYTSNVILFACVRETGHGSYGELMTGILGKSGAMVLDAFICVEGVGAVATYLVFIMDYVPQVCALGGEDLWCTDPFRVVLAASAIIWPLSCLRGLSALRYTSTCSIVTIIFTSLVVIVRAPRQLERTGHSLSEAVGKVYLSMGAMQVLSMACFAFMTHTNTPEIALQLKRPTPQKSYLVVGGGTGLLWAVYCAIAVCGFVSFLEETQQDFLTNYDVRDGLVVMCRCMLSATLVFACPINICPAIQALCNIIQSLSPTRGHPARSLYLQDATRVPITTGCFAVALGVALRTPHVADLISLLCAFFTSPLMFTFPALMYRGILRRKGWAIPAALHSMTAALWVAEIYRLVSP